MSRKMSVGLLSLVFLVTLVAIVPVPVEAKKPIKWWQECHFNYPTFKPTWVGDIWREDGSHGDFYWDNLGYVVLGPDGDKVQHFWGVWGIDWDDSGYIEGTHKGTFTYSINQANIVGRITGTSDGWSHLMDCKIHTLSPVDLVVGYAECYFVIN